MIASSALVAWTVDFTDDAGKRGRKQFDGKPDADAFRVKIEGELQMDSYRADAAKVSAVGKRARGPHGVSRSPVEPCGTQEERARRARARELAPPHAQPCGSSASRGALRMQGNGRPAQMERDRVSKRHTQHGRTRHAKLPCQSSWGASIIQPATIGGTQMQKRANRKSTLDGIVFHLLHRASQRADQLFEREAGNGGLTPRQFAVLLAVGEAADPSQTDLVAATQRSKPIG